jgi:hypothetical protein
MHMSDTSDNEGEMTTTHFVDLEGDEVGAITVVPRGNLEVGIVDAVPGVGHEIGEHLGSALAAHTAVFHLGHHPDRGFLPARPEHDHVTRACKFTPSSHP